MKGSPIRNSRIDAQAVFGADLCSEIAKIEEESFWFKVRAELIIWALGTYFPRAKKFLEVGCGTGFILSQVEKSFPYLCIAGCDNDNRALVHAARRLKKGKLFELDIRRMKWENEFDVIGAFDVIEHIPEDTLVLTKIRKATRGGGGIILTVPQHPILWSWFDQYSRHIRRYKSHLLKREVEKAGFKVVKMTSFFSLLLPLMVGSRLLKPNFEKGGEALKGLNPPTSINRILKSISRWEFGAIRDGFSFPVGGSLLVVASREENFYDY